ncbi:MAG TPA: hypothetical protein VLF66_12845 [Thermoanaerobaculia bacterium]|nr:hypothetical protein [Thermoanaerobaculia bacterium]
MSRLGEVVSVLYVTSDGLVRSGRLVLDPQRKGEQDPVLMSRAGRSLRPADVLARLEPRPATEGLVAALPRAVRAGYRVEGM